MKPRTTPAGAPTWHAINEFYFTDWSDSYAEAFGDRSARGVIAVAVYGEVAPPPRMRQPYDESDRSADAASAPAAGAAEKSARRDESPGTGYGDRRVDHAVEVEFVAQSAPTAATSSSTNGARRCAASTCSSAARRTGSGMNPR